MGQAENLENPEASDITVSEAIASGVMPPLKPERVCALEFAKERHKDDYRRGGEPYIHHLIRVAAYARLYIGDGILIHNVCLLHDVVEDGHATLPEIKEKFGEACSIYVYELTNEFTCEAYPYLKRRERKMKEFERLAECELLTQQIKLCDRLDNCLGTKLGDGDFRKKYFEETKWLLQKIGHTSPQLSSLLTEIIS